MQGGERVLAQRHHVVQLAPALPALAFATHRNPGDSSCDAIERTCLEARPLDAPTGNNTRLPGVRRMSRCTRIPVVSELLVFEDNP